MFLVLFYIFKKIFCLYFMKMHKSNLQKKGDMLLATADIPVSFLVLSDAEGQKVYLTRNAPRVLARRARRCGL